MFLLLGCLRSQTEYEALLAQAQDADQDGVASVAWGGSDCDDSDPEIRPGAEELCDGVDNDWMPRSVRCGESICCRSRI